MKLLPSKLHSLILVLLCSVPVAADDFAKSIKPLFQSRCAKCHGGKTTNGEVNLKTIANEKQFLGDAELIKRVIDAIDANDMPPEGEPALKDKQREQLLVHLKQYLRRATSQTKKEESLPARRLNRFQYNNSVRDLFQLKRDVFPLSEKLMTRYDRYLTRDRVPETVNVSSHALQPQQGLRGVRPFPKDLRAAHGFDNQANQLTLSPLLLDAYLRLSVSIVESPDFNKDNVGIWNAFFEAPKKDKDLKQELARRLRHFLSRAFRAPVEQATLDRYVTFAASKIETGVSFTAAMKRVASAALSSPLFLYRVESTNKKDRPYQLASRLSYFLWASAPDQALLDAAAKGSLNQQAELSKTIDRMFADPKIERFLDTFPGQWMQLENILAATPDPKKYRLYSLEKNYPAGLQMVMEPLLLFDAVFVENRPVTELISPSFTYQSDFLKTWYTSNLRPPKIDRQTLEAENREKDKRRADLTNTIKQLEDRKRGLLDPIRKQIIAERKKNPKKKIVDLKPYAAWEFNGDLQDSLNRLHLKPHGKVEFKNGHVLLKKSFLLSTPIKMDVRAKSLEVWFKLANLNQPGGGLMGTQGPGDFFDTIVIGERKARHWISGSNGFSRTLDFPGSKEETSVNQTIHLVMVYLPDGNTLLYRNGKPYGKPFRKGRATFPKNRTSIIFGLRHLPAGGNRFLDVQIDRARFYDRALSAEEAASAFTGDQLFVSNEDLLKKMNDTQKKELEHLNADLVTNNKRLRAVPANADINRLQQESRQRYDNQIRGQLRARAFRRVKVEDQRYGGIITNAAMLSMTSGPRRTHPIARGAWIIEVIFNDPPPPPPNDVPPLNEDDSDKNLTIREKFAVHRENAKCAACHARLDPLGFALENYDITGRWRKRYENGRDVDASGNLLRKYPFDDVVKFKGALVSEKRRFAKAFVSHLLRFALARELTAADSLAVEDIVDQTEKDDYRLKSIIRTLVLSDAFHD